MKPTSVDIVFVFDASESMRPCFEGLAKNLDQIVQPLQGFNFKVRLGLVAVSVGKASSGMRVVNVATFPPGEGLDNIYHRNPQDCTGLFTEDGRAFSMRLRSLSLGGDENHLMALDFALDFPFGPLATTRRVVALFSDERIEDGLITENETGRVADLVAKIMARRVQLFAALPSSPLLDELATADCCQVEPIQGGDGLANVNFAKLLGQMAKSISGTSLQAAEEHFDLALFGQDKWGRGSGSFDGLR